jgi:hypothetical protein
VVVKYRQDIDSLFSTVYKNGRASIDPKPHEFRESRVHCLSLAVQSTLSYGILKKETAGTSVLLMLASYLP